MIFMLFPNGWCSFVIVVLCNGDFHGVIGEYPNENVIRPTRAHSAPNLGQRFALYLGNTLQSFSQFCSLTGHCRVVRSAEMWVKIVGLAQREKTFKSRMSVIILLL